MPLQLPQVFCSVRSRFPTSCNEHSPGRPPGRSSSVVSTWEKRRCLPGRGGSLGNGHEQADGTRRKRSGAARSSFTQVSNSAARRGVSWVDAVSNPISVGELSSSLWASCSSRACGGLDVRRPSRCGATGSAATACCGSQRKECPARMRPADPSVLGKKKSSQLDRP